MSDINIGTAEPPGNKGSLGASPSALAGEPRILDRMAAELERAGLVGEARAAKLVYLVLTSRLLHRPLCAAIKGQSSAGKSYLLDRVMALFPANAYHFMTSMSPKALAYGTKPLVHRILVIAEAAGFRKGDDALLLRSLISEGHIHHETVESSQVGLNSRVIEREGPTGLLVTTTSQQLEEELETRMFSIPINDSPAQTTAILAARASYWDGNGNVVPLDPAPWHELQTWLESGERRVVIPYAAEITARIPPAAVRLRRDVDTLWALVASHALLHQAQRERDPKGQIIATLDDYAAVHELVADLLSEGVGASVKPEVRQTVEAVRALAKSGVSLDAIAKQLELDKTTVSRRVKDAGSYLRNMETRSGMVACIVIGDPLPDELEILPRPEQLTGDRCSVAA